MELTFETKTELSNIAFPTTIIHLPDNNVVAIREESQLPTIQTWETTSSDIDWQTPNFSEPSILYGNTLKANWKKSASVGQIGILYDKR